MAFGIWALSGVRAALLTQVSLWADRIEIYSCFWLRALPRNQIAGVRSIANTSNLPDAEGSGVQVAET